MSAKYKGPRHWIREILKEFDQLERENPRPGFEDLDWPEWVNNLWLKLMGISYPGLNFKAVKKWKAKDLGRFLGRQYAGENLIEGEVPVSERVAQEGEAFGAWAEKRSIQVHPEMNWEEFERKNREWSAAWKPQFKQFIQRALASVCERPYVEARAFFESFGKAVVIKPDDFLTERTMGVHEKICWLMIVHWREIERMESIAQLHRTFEQALRPLGLVVKYKTIEKLCQRIKLRLKGPGRPPGERLAQ